MSATEQMLLRLLDDLPDWVCDAFCRIRKGGSHELPQSDVEEFAGAMLASVDKGTDQIRPSIPPNAENEAPDDQDIRLKSISALNNVNALSSIRKLEFSPHGLTVIFGENGAGKSGYARVIKRACNAYSNKKILSNVFATKESLTASALFEMYFANGQKKGDQKWTDGEIINDLAISFFDSDVANLVVDGDNNVVFAPSEVISLKALEDVCRRVGNFIVSKKENVHSNLEIIMRGKIEQTSIAPEVHRILYESSNRDTNIRDIREISIFSENELQEIGKKLKSGSPEDLSDKVRELTEQRKEILAMKELLISRTEKLEEYTTQMLKDLRSLEKHEKAVKISRQIFEKNYLPGTGDDAWAELFDAARAFSEIAYDGKDFPFVGQNAHCVLCQQSLEKEGVTSLQLFDKFVKKDVAKKLKAQRAHIHNVRESISAIGTDLTKIKEGKAMAWVKDLSLKAEIALPNLPEMLERHITVLLNKGESLASKFYQSDTLPKIDNSIAENIDRLCMKIEKQIAGYNKVITNRKESEAQCRNIEARKAISQNLSLFMRFIDLNECLIKLPIIRGRISRQVGEIFKMTCDEILQNNLTNELGRLRDLMGEREITFNLHGGAGQPRLQLVLNGLKIKNVSISSILSDGEHNCLALASFFAQAFVRGGPSILVLDDPVSSVDDDRIEVIASRLQEIADEKQVIVFTHDVYFARMLCRRSKKNVGIWRYRGDLGVISEIPFSAMDHATQLKKINAQIKAIEQREETEHSAPDDQERIEVCYRRLRIAIENLAEDEILKQAITRRRPTIKIGYLVSALENSRLNLDAVKMLRGLHQKISKPLHKQDTAIILKLRDLKKCRDEFIRICDALENI